MARCTAPRGRAKSLFREQHRYPCSAETSRQDLQHTPCRVKPRNRRAVSLQRPLEHMLLELTRCTALIDQWRMGNHHSLAFCSIPPSRSRGKDHTLSFHDCVRSYAIPLRNSIGVQWHVQIRRQEPQDGHHSACNRSKSNRGIYSTVMRGYCRAGTRVLVRHLSASQQPRNELQCSRYDHI